MSMLQVTTTVGTRPEIIILSETIKACDKYFKHVLVHTGQNWDYTQNEVFFEELGLRQPDHYMNAVGDHLGETMGNIISKSYEVLRKVKPDATVELSRAMCENNENTYVANDYQDTNVAVKVTKVIQSYSKIINKVVWDK